MHSQDAPNRHFQEDDQVLVWFPPKDANTQDRDTWSWLPGTVLTQCAPDEWCVIVEVPSLSCPDHGDAPENRLYPLCYRDATEIRAVTPHDWER